MIHAQVWLLRSRRVSSRTRLPTHHNLSLHTVDDLGPTSNRLACWAPSGAAGRVAYLTPSPIRIFGIVNLQGNRQGRCKRTWLPGRTQSSAHKNCVETSQKAYLSTNSLRGCGVSFHLHAGGSGSACEAVIQVRVRPDFQAFIR